MYFENFKDSFACPCSLSSIDGVGLIDLSMFNMFEDFLTFSNLWNLSP